MAENQNAAIFAFDRGAAANGGAPGAKGLDAVNEKRAALLGTGAREVTITDLAVHPRTHNAYVSVMRGQGATGIKGYPRVLAVLHLHRHPASWKDRRRT